MPQLELTKLLDLIVKDWLEDDETPTVQAINSGLCMDFACAVEAHPLLTDCEQRDKAKFLISQLYDQEDMENLGIEERHFDQTKFAASLRFMVKHNIGHVFIKYGEQYFDAECTTGVQNLFELPFFERAAAEVEAEYLQQSDCAPSF